jgi:hypothetical protein
LSQAFPSWYQRWSPPLRLQASHCSTFHIMCDVPSIAVFCSESIECFPGTASNYYYYYLAGCTMFPHLPAPIWQLQYLLSPVASVIPVFFHSSFFSHQSSNPFRPGKFRSTSFSSSWWTPFHNLFCYYCCYYYYLLLLLLLLLFLAGEFLISLWFYRITVYGVLSERNQFRIITLQHSDNTYRERKINGLILQCV